jgi:hypothetical protein
MKDFYAFAGEHPWITISLAMIALGIVEAIFTPFRKVKIVKEVEDEDDIETN